jgi:pimeloyl-ACP methyl ester carboxylesterase
MTGGPPRSKNERRPPKRPEAVLLVHGACTGPWIFDKWAGSFPRATVSAIDLQAGLQLERASMELYAGAVVAEAGRMPWPLLLCGYGMGGLVALMAAAQTLRPELLVLVEPFPPAEIGGLHSEIRPSPGIVEPDETERAENRVQVRPDSALALAEQRRGISVPPPLPFRSLVVYGDRSAEERGGAIARLYGSDELTFSGMDHFDLVLDERVPRAIAQFAGLS